jgi:hypothetical protein
MQMTVYAAQNHETEVPMEVEPVAPGHRTYKVLGVRRAARRIPVALPAGNRRNAMSSL